MLKVVALRLDAWTQEFALLKEDAAGHEFETLKVVTDSQYRRVKGYIFGQI